MMTVNAMGDACPIPVVKTKKAMETLKAGDVVETYVDNEIAVENLTKMAKQTGCAVTSQKLDEGKYSVQITVSEAAREAGNMPEVNCGPTLASNKVVVIRSSVMGEGDPELGKVLIKGFIYALSQMETHPDTILFYNGGAKLTTEGSESLEDLKKMEEEGVEILTCGTCLKHYGLMEKLMVGKVTDMYTIAERMTGADKVIRP